MPLSWNDKAEPGAVGAHYTSLDDIAALVRPFLPAELFNQLLQDAASVHAGGSDKVFEPACGSGDFLLLASRGFRPLAL